MIRVLGIDPGTAITGWAVIDEDDHGRLKAVDYGHIATDKDLREEDRLKEIHQDLMGIIRQFRPQEAAIEKLFYFRNQTTVIPVAQSRGVVLLTLALNDVRISGYTPLQVKQAITGYGKAEKKQVQMMTKSLLGLGSVPKPDDTADAIAIAVCHIHSRKLTSLNSQ